jgi:hypothetical protein
MGGRWQHMTPEEREKFRKGMMSRSGGGPLAEEMRDPREV